MFFSPLCLSMHTQNGYTKEYMRVLEIVILFHSILYDLINASPMHFMILIAFTPNHDSVKYIHTVIFHALA